MRWEDERYVRFYTRDTPEWLALSWQARGLFGLILRAVDRAGMLYVGKLGKKGVAVAVHAPWADVEAPLGELFEDGCLVWAAARAALLIRNYLEAQECAKSDAARKRESRERARAQFGGTSAASEKARTVLNGSHSVTVATIGIDADSEISPDPASAAPNANGQYANGHAPMSQDVTACSHDSGPKVTNGHDASQSVTPCCAVPFLEAKDLRDFATAKVAAPSDGSAELEKGWDPPVLQRLRVAFEATRRSGKIADGAWRAFLAAAQQFSPEIRASAAQTYLERACATDGKGEKYLIGIMRGETREHGGPSKPVPVAPTVPSKSARERAEATAREADLRDRQFREEQARGSDPRALVHRLWLWQRWPQEFPQYAPPEAEASNA